MLTFSNLLFRVIEALAITVAIYLVTRRTLQWSEMAMLVITITITFMVLDLFAPRVGVGARQGSGFGLGFMQVAGNSSYPRQYFDPDAPFAMKGTHQMQFVGPNHPGHDHASFEGDKPMNGPETIEGMSNLEVEQITPSLNEINEHPDLIKQRITQTPSIILQQFSRNPFGKQTQVYDDPRQFDQPFKT